MKIQTFDVYHLRVPLSVPYKLSKVYGTISYATQILVRVETQSGLVGWGEANPTPPFTEETPGGVIATLCQHIGPLLLGHDAMNVATANAVITEILSGNLSARAAIDMALHDIRGKALGVPVHVLLGGAITETLSVGWPLRSGTPEEDRAVVEEKRAEGYRLFMIKMGSQAIEVEIERVRQLTERFSPEFTFIVDANQGWTEAEALRFVHGVNQFSLGMIEQPVRAHNFAALKRIRLASIIPIAADESLQSLEQGARLARENVVDVFSIKVSKNGGISAAQKLAVIAEAANISCFMNSMLESGISQAASLQLGVTLPNLVDIGHAYMSTLRFSDDVTNFAQLVSKGTVQLPKEPGLGINVDEDKVKRLANDHFCVK